MDALFVFSELKVADFMARLQKISGSIEFPLNYPTIHSASETIFIWSILDKSPPIKSGIASSHSELLSIAAKYGIEGFADQYRLEQFAEFIDGSHNIISHIKRPNDLYSICVWENNLHYLCDIPPTVIRENISAEELLEIKRLHGDGEFSGLWQGGYIRNYIRRREANRKLSMPKTDGGGAVFVEFLYSPENTWFIPRKRWVWQRHRIVKKTEKTIFIEEQPYQGLGYLKTGWQAFIVYMIMIDRGMLEADNEFYHPSRRKTFYTKAGAPELKNKRFIDYSVDFEGEYDNDDVIEIPLNSIQWAVSALNLSEWPTTEETIKKAYRIIAQKTHPDKAGGDHRKMSLANRARDLLLREIK